MSAEPTKSLKISRKDFPKGDDGHKTFSIRVKNDLVDELDNIAAKTNRSRNELIGIFLEYAISNCELDLE